MIRSLDEKRAQRISQVSLIAFMVCWLLMSPLAQGTPPNIVLVLADDLGYLLGENFMWGKVMLFETCN